MGITFKKQAKKTGLRSVGHPWPNVDLKYKKQVFGYIRAPFALGPSDWSICIAVKDGESFRWKTLKWRGDSEEDARKFIKQHEDTILSWDLHYVQ